MASNGWRGRGDPMEDRVEKWLMANGINYRRADSMKTHLDFFLPDYQIYIECKRFHTPRAAEQIERAPDVILIQGMACMKLLERLTFVTPASANGRPSDFDSEDCGSNPRVGTKVEIANG